MRKSTKEKYKIIIDSNILFSAIRYPNGNEFMLFEKAEKVGARIIIYDYVYEEVREVFRDYDLDPDQVTRYLQTFRYVELVDIDISNEKALIKQSEELITDRDDRPIFVYAKKMIDSDPNIYFVSGNIRHFFKDEVKKALRNRVLRTSEMLELL